MSEIWDLYDARGNKSEKTIERNSGERIPDGLYHIVCDILVQHEDGSYLLMERDHNKDVYPGYFEAAAGGSAITGESPLMCAVRELREETGIIVSTDDLELVNHIVVDRNHCIFFSYYVKVKCKKDSVTLQEGETVGYRWVDEKGFLEYVDSDKSIKNRNLRYEEYISGIRRKYEK